MTTVKLDLHDILVRQLGITCGPVPATVDIAELLEFSDMQEVEQDLEPLLAEQKTIAHIWCIKDVKSVRDDLNDEQAWAVLQEVSRNLDSNRGINWDTIEQTAYDLFGSGNAYRIERCQKALAVYEEPELRDLLADTMHWCNAHGQDFDAALASAREHFEVETPNVGESA